MPGLSSIERSVLPPPTARAKSYGGNIVAITLGRPSSAVVAVRSPLTAYIRAAARSRAAAHAIRYFFIVKGYLRDRLFFM
ncbi:hypothetical protein SDC9_196458 [bioreactor metagenome]|uniref:Uncharacterized protein n=1 Tax=bioreactor metagenome TaxID=1076179 RepID=A0A645ID53_9ZZZZ